jgi:spore germination cell wall hydrolase CwlJ-like protein
MEARIAKLKKEQDKAEQAFADTTQREKQLLEQRMKLKQDQDAKDKWRQDLKRQEEERRQQIRHHNELKKQKLAEAKSALLRGRRVKGR